MIGSPQQYIGKRGERVGWFKMFDLFPKASEEIITRSPIRGSATFIIISIMSWVILWALFDFYLTPTSDILVVDDGSVVTGPIPLNLDILFPGLTCEQAHMDFTDTSNGHLAVEANSLRYNPVENDDGSEGCAVYGYVRLPKSPGNIHVAAGSSEDRGHGKHSHHVHQVKISELREGFNASHEIRRFRVGKRSRANSPLDKTETYLNAPGQIIYIMHIVPRVDIRGRVSLGYSVTQHVRPMDITQTQFPLPGVFFRYDFYPYIIQESYSGISLFQLFIRLVCIMGSTFVVLRLIFSGISGVVERRKLD